MGIGWFSFFMFLAMAVAACDKINPSARSYVATVNDSKIYADEYQAALDKKMKMLPQEYREDPAFIKRFEDEVLESVIVERIMHLRAKELNLSVNNAELENRIKEIRTDYGDDFSALFAGGKINYEQWKETFRKELLLQKLIEADVNPRIKISEDEVEDYFNEHRGDYKTDLRARVYQIVVSNTEAAEKAVVRLRAGEDFSTVAADVSISPEARRGGDLGFITRWMMPEPLDKTIFNLPVNQISPIVQSPYGYHVFKVTEIQRAGERSLEEVREDVIADIRLRKQESAFMVWLDELKKKAVIQRNPEYKR